MEVPYFSDYKSLQGIARISQKMRPDGRKKHTGIEVTLDY